MDVVNAVINGEASFEWAEVVSSSSGSELRVFVLRDAMKFGGVRHHANPIELQTIADLTDSLLLTPKVADLIWEQATLRFDAIVRADGDIAANSTSERISELIDKLITELGGDHGQLIECVGKYWILTNKLLRAGLVYGSKTACNYGWHTSVGGKVSTVTPKVNGKIHKVWQNMGFAHNYLHEDPSQTIRLMYKHGLLKRKGENEFSRVMLTDVMMDQELHHHVSHEGVLLCHRQPGVALPRGNVVLTHYAPPAPFQQTA
jgi:hypothetical protein